ncbi:hypothetical protein BCR34DRAFT_584512 [Clohesyomyces aquaticus]|uniref:Uncharacterized protein n=1 Tax=Clohesyomyces aquaticus TaxID=1231657 RepID=A0A1Y2A1X5_9PLEO|nr:hypothetical protein BCR34DRAFT_584512 [Clohesyomyces aquaticus]
MPVTGEYVESAWPSSQPRKDSPSEVRYVHPRSWAFSRAVIPGGSPPTRPAATGQAFRPVRKRHVDLTRSLKPQERGGGLGRSLEGPCQCLPLRQTEVATGGKWAKGKAHQRRKRSGAHQMSRECGDSMIRWPERGLSPPTTPDAGCVLGTYISMWLVDALDGCSKWPPWTSKIPTRAPMAKWKDCTQDEAHVGDCPSAPGHAQHPAFATSFHDLENREGRMGR